MKKPSKAPALAAPPRRTVRRPVGLRRKAVKNRWSRSKKAPRLFRQFFRLPTRETLTYAEAQKLVDIDVNGELFRLNICEPLEVSKIKILSFGAIFR